MPEPPKFVTDKISYLWSLSKEALSFSNVDLANFYLYNMQELSYKHGVDLNTGSTVCKVCGQIMIPGFSSKVRIKRAKKMPKNLVESFNNSNKKFIKKNDQMMSQKCLRCDYTFIDKGCNRLVIEKVKEVTKEKKKVPIKPSLKPVVSISKTLGTSNNQKLNQNKASTKGQLKGMLLGDIKKSKKRKR